ncbi:MAG: hypothetical protein V8R39_03370 [Clostridia bacterium]
MKKKRDCLNCLECNSNSYETKIELEKLKQEVEKLSKEIDEFYEQIKRRINR